MKTFFKKLTGSYYVEQLKKLHKSLVEYKKEFNTYQGVFNFRINVDAVNYTNKYDIHIKGNGSILNLPVKSKKDLKKIYEHTVVVSEMNSDQ